MKCDELKQYEVFVSNPYNTGGSFREIAVLPADKVDEAIAELKQAMHDAEMSKDLAEAANTEYRLDIEKIKAENERLKNELKHSEDELESYFIFEKEIKQKLRATRRALYKACVNWAHFAIAFFSQYSTKEKWYKMKLKCQKKMEEYK